MDFISRERRAAIKKARQQGLPIPAKRKPPRPQKVLKLTTYRWKGYDIRKTLTGTWAPIAHDAQGNLAPNNFAKLKDARKWIDLHARRGLNNDARTLEAPSNHKEGSSAGE